MFPFLHPTTIMLAGPTGCGKTQLLVRALRERMIEPFPERIVWVFAEWQPAYEVLVADTSLPTIEFIKGFNDELYETFNVKSRNLLVLDDQMENANAHRKSASITKYFTQGSHHRNLTVIYIVQNLFSQQATTRTISLNSHYLITFKNMRDRAQVGHLAQQMYPNNRRFLMEAFIDATRIPYGYLVIDVHPTTFDDYRIRSDIFNTNPSPAFYVPRI